MIIYDPQPYANEYASRMFFDPLRKFARDNSIPCTDTTNLEHPKASMVVICTDHLNEERIQMLKNNGNRIIGFNVTDSSYISGPIRYVKSLPLIDHIFMLSGVQVVNELKDFTFDDDLNLVALERPFLSEDAWEVFTAMRLTGKLHSLPYVSWDKIPEGPREPWAHRSQKALIRGGGHARRILLALFLSLKDRLDPNSGFVLHPYFSNDMNPAFRYCDECRSDYHQNRHARNLPPSDKCNSPAFTSFNTDALYAVWDLGQWNNRCPRSFFWLAEQFSKKYGQVDMGMVETMLNARWLSPADHIQMLGHILFTSDLKWIHSIYAPQRFWEAASAKCISVLPERTVSQEYFPVMLPGQNYRVFKEDFSDLDSAFSMGREEWEEMSGRNRDLYEKWMSPTVYPISNNLLTHIWETMNL